MSKKKDGTALGRPTRVPKAAEPAKPTTGTTRKAGGGATPKAKQTLESAERRAPAKIAAGTARAATGKAAPKTRTRATPITTARKPATKARKPEPAPALEIDKPTVALLDVEIASPAQEREPVADEPAPDDTIATAAEAGPAKPTPYRPFETAAGEQATPYRPFETAARSAEASSTPTPARGTPSARTLPIGLVFLVVTVALILGLLLALGVFHKQ